MNKTTTAAMRVLIATALVAVLAGGLVGTAIGSAFSQPRVCDYFDTTLTDALDATNRLVGDKSDLILVKSALVQAQACQRVRR